MQKQFYRQLDGLRAIAVIGVMISHWVLLPFVKKLGLGFWGVNLFFVLSGFLITEILLKQIIRNESRSQILKSFYWKRTLRIFPIFYLVVFLALLCNLDQSRNFSGYLFTYTLNFYNALSGNEGDYLAHLWSLCVEEQFYLLWPFLLLLVNRKHHLALIVSIIVVALCFRLAFSLGQIENYRIYNYRMMPACLDALGLGALLAYLKLFQTEKLKKILRIRLVPLLLLPFIVATPFVEDFEQINETLLRFCVSVCCFFIIGNAVFGLKNKAGKLLESPPLQYLGKISYGLYLYHLMISMFFERNVKEVLFDHLPGFVPDIIRYNLFILTFPLYFILTLSVAALSYKYIEKPFLRIKDRIGHMPGIQPENHVPVKTSIGTIVEKQLPTA